MADLGATQVLKVVQEKQMSVEEILEIVYKANREKGYDAVNQITGYLVSDDPTYITSYNFIIFFTYFFCSFNFNFFKTR